MPTLFSKMSKNQKIVFTSILGSIIIVLLYFSYSQIEIEMVIAVILVMIGTITVLTLREKKSKIKSTIRNQPKPRRGWNESQKEQVRNRQRGRCNRCRKVPPRWHYDHVDGNRENNSMSNCQGLCPNCHDVKTHEED